MIMNNVIINQVRIGANNHHIIKPVQPTSRPQKPVTTPSPPPVTRPQSPPIRIKQCLV